jgi:hypothetical protein
MRLTIQNPADLGLGGALVADRVTFAIAVRSLEFDAVKAIIGRSGI